MARVAVGLEPCLNDSAKRDQLALRLKDAQRHDLLEVLEDRYARASTVVTSQLPLANWHSWIGDPTLADAILDRLVNNAYKIDLKGTSRRKGQPDPTT